MNSSKAVQSEIIRKLREKEPYWGWVEGMYLAGNDDGIAMRLLDGQGYEPESRKLWKSLCKDAPLVIDVGAHTGRFSLDAWSVGAKEVLSIEPHHLNYARLLMNLAHSDYKTEGCLLSAASDENNIVKLIVRGANNYCSSGGRIGEEEGQRCFPIFARRLDSIVSESVHHLVKVVKIDTERHGAKVLNGMPHILSFKPDLILECIEDGMTEILKPWGYKFYKINEGGERGDGGERGEKAGLSPVDDLKPDDPFTFDSPNRYATVKSVNSVNSVESVKEL